LFPLAEDSGPRIKEINDYFIQKGKIGRFNHVATEPSGGKQFESNIVVGAFNKLNFEEFVNSLKNNVHFEYPSDVQIIYKTDDSDVFQMMKLKE
jgi:hypothetical protein